MTFQVKTLIEDVEVKGPFSNKKTGSEFDAHILKTKNGEYTQYVSKDKSPAVLKGDEVEIFYDESKGFKGTFNKVVKLVKLEASSKPKTTEKLRAVPASLAAGVSGKPLPETKLTLTSSIPSKDISMEVSGLLQALINTGHFTESAKDGNLDLEELELSLIHVLNLKRRIAKELEEKGSV